jgi:spore coat protein A, manganese oxidase
LSPTRRKFLKQLPVQISAFSLLSSAAAPALAQQAMQMHDQAAPTAQGRPAILAHPPTMLHCLELAPFVDALPLPERILRTPALDGKGPHTVRIAMREIHAKVHRDVPATRFWSYARLLPSSQEQTPQSAQHHRAEPHEDSFSALSPLIEARAGQPLQIEWVNHLPTKHFLPVDFSLHGCGHDIPEVRACVHLHGACTQSKEDGQPEDWFVPGKSRICRYPLQQDATALWYHDHAMGLNRLNIYAGLFGQFLIRDHAEDALNLPSGAYEVPLTLYDRNFTADGQLFYPTSGIPDRPWVPEFSGDAILINGKVRPYFEVEPRPYRFRVLNAANSRFFGLTFTKQQPFHQIGTDQGLLPAPVPLTSLMLAPAERADLLIDFSQSAGQRLHLLTGAFEILEFRVAPSANPSAAPSSASAKPATLPATLRPVPRLPESSAITTRTITLNEYQDNAGNPMIMLLNRKHWYEPVTETPRLNTTEIWEFVNLTEDTHPMHLHLVRFQLLDRRVFDTFDYLMHKQLRFQGPVLPPDPNELGWKDTIQCPPAMITRIIVRFEGYPGRYLYHCHILEHESNDMMRPFEVLA